MYSASLIFILSISFFALTANDVKAEVTELLCASLNEFADFHIGLDFTNRSLVYVRSTLFEDHVQDITPGTLLLFDENTVAWTDHNSDYIPFLGMFFDESTVDHIWVGVNMLDLNSGFLVMTGITNARDFTTLDANSFPSQNYMCQKSLQ